MPPCASTLALTFARNSSAGRRPTPTTGRSRRPRFTMDCRAGMIFLEARSPVAPKNTRASARRASASSVMSGPSLPAPADLGPFAARGDGIARRLRVPAHHATLHPGTGSATAGGSGRATVPRMGVRRDGDAVGDAMNTSDYKQRLLALEKVLSARTERKLDRARDHETPSVADVGDASVADETA